MNKRKLLQRMLNSSKNIKFSELIVLLNAFAFYETRREGSHHIFKNATVAEFINIQEVNGEAKPYQVKQFLALIEKYNLILEDD